MLCNVYLGMYRNHLDQEVADITAQFDVVIDDPQFGLEIACCTHVEVYRNRHRSKVYEGRNAERVWSCVKPRMFVTIDRQYELGQKIADAWRRTLNDRPGPNVPW